MTMQLAAPLLLPFLAAALAMLAWRWVAVQRWLGVAGAVGQLAAGIVLLVTVRSEGVVATQIGDWPAPFGITLVADLLSAGMVVITGLMGLAVVVFSFGGLDNRRESFGYYPLLLILLVGIGGAFLTGDIFNLFVWFEVMLIASFVLLALGGERAQLVGALKYVTINLVSSAFFLAAVGILYGLTGTLNMADLSERLRDLDAPVLETTVAMLLLVVFGIKAAVFPLFFWLPASYHTPPVVVSAIFAGLLTKVGVYALIRTFTLLFVGDVGFTHTLLLVVAGLTMVIGAIGAVTQQDLRRVFSFLVISAVGYMVMGLGLFTAFALGAALFYMVQDVVAKTALFLISGLVRLVGGSFSLARLGGLYRTNPVLAGLFLLPALSVAGIPPMSGFAAKVGLVQAGLEGEQYLVVGLALVASVVTLLAVAVAWGEAFWKSAPEGASIDLAEYRATSRGERLSMFAPVAVLVALVVVLGLAAQPVLELALEAGDQLMAPDAYLDAVLGADR
jgi:multicomponent Na+:H+ antiporter subunit D